MTTQPRPNLAFVLDGKGGAREIPWDQVNTTALGTGESMWLHLNREPDTQTWLYQDSGLDELTCDALMAEVTRPRALDVKDGLMMILRGVNTNPDADPEDMVGIRVLMQEKRVITVRLRRLAGTQSIRNALERGQGPTGPGSFVQAVCAYLTARMEPILTATDEELGVLEEDVFAGKGGAPETLAETRYRVITLMRYLSPQHAAMLAFVAKAGGHLSDDEKNHILEHADTTLRYYEDLSAMRERTLIVYDEVRTQLNERMNRTMYMLGVVTAVLLPPSLVAGIMGANVAGMPGTETPWAFAAMVGLIVIASAVEVWVLKKLDWI